MHYYEMKRNDNKTIVDLQIQQGINDRTIITKQQIRYKVLSIKT